MSAKKNSLKILVILCSFLPFIALSQSTFSLQRPPLYHTWACETVAQQLGWVPSNENYCGGYYLEAPFTYPTDFEKKNAIIITSNHGLISQHSTSFLEDKVTVIRFGEELTANKAFVYRNTSGKLNAIDMIGNVHLRQPNTLVIAKKGRYNLETKTKSLIDIIYRTSLSGRRILGPEIDEALMLDERKITALTAWGEAYEFSSSEPKVYELTHASFTTCPPINPAWQVKANHIVLDKNTGRGYATHARFLIKDVPVFYSPYFSFSIDKQRKSGFLWPTFSPASNQWGPYVLVPFYWNMAPNYDMTITTGLLTKRGVQFSDNFRYLTHTSSGKMNFSILPNDRAFSAFKTASFEQYKDSDDPVIQAELNRLLSDSDTRKAFFWRDDSQFNHHWSSHIDFNYAGDDYYLQNFGSNLNEITTNQLLQEADLFYEGENWNFTGRLQAYQTLHPLGQPQVQNSYRRFPQLVLNGDYPNQYLGLQYFINNEATHFERRNAPGDDTQFPIGNRLHTQPGISLPLYWPYGYFNPRMQLALTDYNLYQTAGTGTPKSIHRALPIFDVASGLALTRHVTWFNQGYEQTLEPQAYYTYIPYRDQSDIPIFDTTVNTLNYDQLFNYNRFTGLDRIGDANQISLGVTTRLIDQASGFERMRLGVGDIIYFANRKVTLCNDNSCTDNPNNPSNHYRLSPLSGMLKYMVNPFWSFASYVIWNPISKQLENTTLGFHYQSAENRILNLGYNYARGGDILSGVVTNRPSDNLKVTDLSLVWPLLRDVSGMGRWSQNWNHRRLQNLLYGLQYDTCCWAVRLVGGRAFIGIDANNNNKPKYNNEFYIQFNLKGLGNIGYKDPSSVLNSINGYNTQFGQEF